MNVWTMIVSGPSYMSNLSTHTHKDFSIYLLSTSYWTLGFLGWCTYTNQRIQSLSQEIHAATPLYRGLWGGLWGIHLLLLHGGSPQVHVQKVSNEGVHPWDDGRCGGWGGLSWRRWLVVAHITSEWKKASTLHFIFLYM